LRPNHPASSSKPTKAKRAAADAGVELDAGATHVDADPQADVAD